MNPEIYHPDFQKQMVGNTTIPIIGSLPDFALNHDLQNPGEEFLCQINPAFFTDDLPNQLDRSIFINCQISTDENGRSILKIVPPFDHDDSLLFLLFQDKLILDFNPSNIQVNVTSICASSTDILSNQLARSMSDLNPLTPSLSESPLGTTICFDNADPAHPTKTTITKNGATADLHIAPNGRTQIVLQTAVVNGETMVVLDKEYLTLSQLVDSLAQQTAVAESKGDIELSRFTILTAILNASEIEHGLQFVIPATIENIPPTQTPVIIDMPVEPTPQSQLAVVTQEIAKMIEPRTTFADHLSVELDCADKGCPDVYFLNNLSSPKVADLLEAYQTREVLSSKTGEKLHDVVSLSQKSWLDTLKTMIGIKTKHTEVTKLDTKDKHFKFSELLYSYNDPSGTWLLLRNKDKYYIVKGNNKLLKQLTISALDKNGTIDQITTQVLQNIQNDVNKPVDPFYEENSSSSIHLTPSHAIITSQTGANVAYTAQAYKTDNTAVLRYSQWNDGYIQVTPTDSPYGLNGIFSGILYYDPQTKKFLVGITSTIIDGYGQPTTKYLLPIILSSTSDY